MSNIEGLVVLTGEEGLHQTDSRDDEIKYIISEEGDGEEFIINKIHCKIIRNYGGIWCGYAGVDHDHPWYGKAYQEVVEINEVKNSIDNRNPNNVNILSMMIDIMEDNLDDGKCSISTAINVHGGITYSSKMDDSDLWYFGFDCGHCHDYIPSYSSSLGDTSGLTYRTKEFVINECHRLVDQLLTVPYDKGV